MQFDYYKLNMCRVLILFLDMFAKNVYFCKSIIK